MRLMSGILGVSALLYLGSSALAGSFLTGGFGFGFVQASYMNPGSLNGLLKDHGYPQVENKVGIGFGGGGYGIKGRLMFGLEGGSLSTGITRKGGQETWLGGGFLSVNLGYGLLRRERDVIYVNGGIGYAGLSVSVKTQGGVFDTYKQKDLRGSIGKVGVAYIRNTKGLIIGFEAGAIQPLLGLVADGRRVGTTFFGRILVGGGGF